MGLVILQLALKITSCFYILNMSMFFIIMFVISETYHIYSYYLNYILYLYDRGNMNKRDVWQFLFDLNYYI